MNKFFMAMVALIATLFAANAFAWNPPPSPAPASWIADPSGVLSVEAHHRLDVQLIKINQSSANEIAALILPTLDGQDIRDVGIYTAKAWGVGKKGLDNGVLVVLAMKEHKSDIETGKGVEGDLPDLKASDILVNVVRPHMRKGDVEGALSSTFDAIASSIADHKTEAAALAAKRAAAANNTATSPAPHTASCSVSSVGADDPLGWLVVLGAFALVLYGIAHFARSQRERSRLRQEKLTARLASEAQLRRTSELTRLQRAARHNETILPRPPVVHSVNPVPPPAPVHQPLVSHPVVATTAVVAAAELARQQHEFAEELERNARARERARRDREEELERNARDRARARRDREAEERRNRADDDGNVSIVPSLGDIFDSNDTNTSSGDDTPSSPPSDPSGGDMGGGDMGGGGASSDW
jgi:uncharacterized membrane protein YgcG